jgi:acetoacetyl-CoA reductase/3-oxoacyl-[acyl-carrier protein] reductase
MAIITGGGRGIGRAITLALAQQKFDVVLTHLTRRDCCEQTATDVRALGCEALVVEADVTQRESVRQLISTATEKFGRIDVLVNNAGILQQKPFNTITDEDWDTMLATNLKGVFLCSQEIMPVMVRESQVRQAGLRQGGGGSIINISSSGGQLGGMLAVHYAVSKAGVISLTRSLARVGAPDGIRVNCVTPGLIETEMSQKEIHSEVGQQKINREIPLRRAGLAAEVAGAVVFLASEEAAYITGQSINVNGGLYMG